MKKQISISVLFILLAALISGGTPEHVRDAEDYKAMAAGYGETEAVVMEDFRRTGELINDKQNVLTMPQKELLIAYMERYCEALSELKMVKIEDLFSPQAMKQAAFHQNTWEYEIELRAMQQTDLKLQEYQYEMAVDEVLQNEDGSIQVTLTEHSIQRFVQHPEVDTEFFNILHRFVLEQAEGAWKIREHEKKDGINQNMMRLYEEVNIGDILEDGSYFVTQKDALLKLAQEQKYNRNLSGESGFLPATCNSYNGEAAISYADSWVGKRNKEWSDFTGRGGNCQNFVSQCLLAGGIPMDTEGEHIWKWYSEDINDGNLVYGNSTSWISVEAFYQYAGKNTGSGLVAITEAPYYAGEVGDEIRMGFPGSWSHTVIISKVIRNEQGETIDYLVHSNTADLKYFPVSAYSLPCQSLIKIAGWN